MATTQEFNQYDEWKKEQNSTYHRFIRDAPPIQFILILVLIGVSLFFFFSSEKTLTKIMFAGLSVAVIVFFAMKSKQTILISEPKAKFIAKEVLTNKMVGGDSELPIGTRIIIYPNCKMRRWGDKWAKWEVGAGLKFPDGRIKDLRIDIDVYTGGVIGIVDAPTGYTGREALDFKPVFIQSYYGRTPPQPQ